MIETNYTELKNCLTVKAVGRVAYASPADCPFRGGATNLYTVIFCDGGESTLKTDDKKIALPIGTLIVVDKREEFTLTAASPKAKALVIETEFIRDTEKINPFSPRKVSVLGKTLMTELVSVCGEIFGNVSSFAEKLPRLGISPTAFQTLKNSLELALIDTFSEKNPSGKLEADLTSGGGTGFTAAKNIYEILKRRSDEALTLADIAEETYFSVSYIKTVFKKYAHKSVMSAFAEIKAERAKELLLEGLSVGEVAERLSYGSISHFSSAFRKTVGKTPTEFRNGAE